MHTPESDEQTSERLAGTRPRRWLCRCTDPPTLLATLEGNQIYLKIRDRYYHIEGLLGRIQATCPRCGKQHAIELGMTNGE